MQWLGLYACSFLCTCAVFGLTVFIILYEYMVGVIGLAMVKFLSGMVGVNVVQVPMAFLVVRKNYMKLCKRKHSPVHVIMCLAVVCFFLQESEPQVPAKTKLQVRAVKTLFLKLWLYVPLFTLLHVDFL